MNNAIWSERFEKRNIKRQWAIIIVSSLSNSWQWNKKTSSGFLASFCIVCLQFFIEFLLFLSTFGWCRRTISVGKEVERTKQEFDFPPSPIPTGIERSFIKGAGNYQERKRVVVVVPYVWWLSNATVSSAPPCWSYYNLLLGQVKAVSLFSIELSTDPFPTVAAADVYSIMQTRSSLYMQLISLPVSAVYLAYSPPTLCWLGH